MFCEKCGTKNENDARFCEKCGNKLSNNKNELMEKFSKLPKKTKMIMGSVILIVILAIIILIILLSNPLKRVSDNLDYYYANYKENDVKELRVVAEILNNNKADQEVLGKIEKISEDKINGWVKNFNTNYKNKEVLANSYQRIKSILKAIYEYYDGSNYILNYEDYQNHLETLSELYSSKINYLYGSVEKDEYSKYAYFERVIEQDSYYKEARDYIAGYVKEELEDFLTKYDDILEADEKVINEELLDDYLEQLKYLEENKIINNVDLSSTEEYQKTYEDTINKIVEALKVIVAQDEENLDYNQAYDLVKSVRKVIKDEDKNAELEKLESSLEKKLPDNLVDKYVVEYHNSYDSSYGVNIKDNQYESYIQFSFNKDGGYRIYRLNKYYSKFKAKIVVGDNWPGDFKGEIVITSGSKELFRSKEITKESNFMADIDIDITDVDDMKIEFVTTNDGGLNGYYLYIVEPYLYK